MAANGHAAAEPGDPNGLCVVTVDDATGAKQTAQLLQELKEKAEEFKQNSSTYASP